MWRKSKLMKQWSGNKTKTSLCNITFYYMTSSCIWNVFTHWENITHSLVALARSWYFLRSWKRYVCHPCINKWLWEEAKMFNELWTKLHYRDNMELRNNFYRRNIFRGVFLSKFLPKNYRSIILLKVFV